MIVIFGVRKYLLVLSVSISKFNGGEELLYEKLLRVCELMQLDYVSSFVSVLWKTFLISLVKKNLPSKISSNCLLTFSVVPVRLDSQIVVITGFLSISVFLFDVEKLFGIERRVWSGRWSEEMLCLSWYFCVSSWRWWYAPKCVWFWRPLV